MILSLARRTTLVLAVLAVVAVGARVGTQGRAARPILTPKAPAPRRASMGPASTAPGPATRSSTAFPATGVRP